MDKEIHIVLINYYQHEADGNKQFIAFAQDYLSVDTTPAPANIPINTHQFSETAFSISYFRIALINISCKTDDVVRNKHSIRKRNRIVGK